MANLSGFVFVFFETVIILSQEHKCVCHYVEESRRIVQKRQFHVDHF